MSTENELKVELEKVKQVQDKMLTTMQNVVNTLNETRQSNESVQQMLSALFRTIADGRPLDQENVKESHLQSVSEKINRIFDKAVNNGYLKNVDEVQNDSIVLVQEFDANGVEVHRASELVMEQVSEEYKSLFLSKTLGQKVAVFKDGVLQGNYVIQGIFKPTEVVQKSYVENESQETQGTANTAEQPAAATA